MNNNRCKSHTILGFKKQRFQLEKLKKKINTSKPLLQKIYQKVKLKQRMYEENIEKQQLKASYQIQKQKIKASHQIQKEQLKASKSKSLLIQYRSLCFEGMKMLITQENNICNTLNRINNIKEKHKNQSYQLFKRKKQFTLQPHLFEDQSNKFQRQLKGDNQSIQKNKLYQTFTKDQQLKFQSQNPIQDKIFSSDNFYQKNNYKKNNSFNKQYLYEKNNIQNTLSIHQNNKSKHSIKYKQSLINQQKQTKQKYNSIAQSKITQNQAGKLHPQQTKNLFIQKKELTAAYMLKKLKEKKCQKNQKLLKNSSQILLQKTKQKAFHLVQVLYKDLQKLNVFKKSKQKNIQNIIVQSNNKDKNNYAILNADQKFTKNKTEIKLDQKIKFIQMQKIKLSLI